MGRSLIYKSADEMQKKIDEYFADCEGKPLRDEDGHVLTDKYGKPVLTGAHPPTVTGLALFLGFGGRQALLNYQGRKAFKDTVTRAKARVEEYAESRLFDKDGFQGARFTLERNFKGWREEDEATADVLSKLDSVILSLDKTMGKGGDGHA